MPDDSSWWATRCCSRTHCCPQSRCSNVVRIGRRSTSFARRAASAIVMLALVGVVGWLLALAVPRPAPEAARRFASVAPDTLRRLLATRDPGRRGYGAAWSDQRSIRRATTCLRSCRIGRHARLVDRKVGLRWSRQPARVRARAAVAFYRFRIRRPSCGRARCGSCPSSCAPAATHRGKVGEPRAAGATRGQAVVLVIARGGRSLLALLQFPAARAAARRDGGPRTGDSVPGLLR